MQEAAPGCIFKNRKKGERSRVEEQKTAGRRRDGEKHSNGWRREFRGTRPLQLLRIPLSGFCELAKVIMIMDINGFISKH